MTNSEAKLLDTTDLSLGFPNCDWSSLVQRENYIAEIENYFAGDTRIVFLEGQEDVGKTTLCAQFSKRNHKNTISIFFNPQSSLDYGIEFFCHSVVPQMNFLYNNFNKKNKQYENSLDAYSTLCNIELRKIFGKGKNVVYLVIDGLSERQDSSEFVKDIFRMLPIGVDFYRILISGNRSNFEKLGPQIKSQRIQSFPVAGFTKSQIKSYPGMEGVGDLVIDDIFNLTRGYPGRLNTIRSLLSTNRELIENLSDTLTYKQLVQLDCEKVDLEPSHINTILSLLANSDQSFEISEIAQICDISEEFVQEIIGRVHVLKLNGNHLEFISTTHKQHFQGQLRVNKSKVDKLLMLYYSSDERARAQFELARLYAKNNDWYKLMPIINEQFIQGLLESNGNLQSANQSLEMGIRASTELKKYPNLLRYTIQGSILNELDNYLFWESEVNARVAINDFEGAIGLANSAFIKVDQLRLLALIARKQKELHQKVEEVLISQIQELYRMVDLPSAGEKIYDIVSDLIYAIPNLAIEMIEKSSGDNSERDINEWVIAKLSIAAIDSSIRDIGSPESSRKIEAIQSISNASVRKVNQAITFMVGNYSAQKVLDEVKKLPDPRERLSLLRLWLSNLNSKINNIELVINRALDELIEVSSDITVTIDILKEISNQLPYIQDSKIKLGIYHRFKRIEKTITELGLTKNKYIYKLNIFHAEYTLELPISIDTINGILNEVENLNDPLIQLESYSEIFVKLRSFFVSKEILRKVSFVENRLLQLSVKLFKETAMHYKVSEHLIKTLAKKHPKMAILVCNQINLLADRDQGRILILESYLENSTKRIDPDILDDICNTFEANRAKNIAYYLIVKRFSEPKSLPSRVIEKLIKFIIAIDQFDGFSIQLSAYIHAIVLITKNELWKGKLLGSLERKILEAWKNVDADWARIDSGYKICSELAMTNIEFAKKIFYDTEALKENTWIDSKRIAVTYLNSVKLVVRAFNGALSNKMAIEKELKILSDMISTIPSNCDRLLLWSEIGLNCVLKQRDDEAKRIFSTHVLPLFEQLAVDRRNLERLPKCILIIYIYNSVYAKDMLSRFPIELKDISCGFICDYYISKRTPFEIYEDKVTKNKSNYLDLLNAVDVLGLMENDANIFYQLSNLYVALDENKVISNTQRNQVAYKIEEIIKFKLPDKKNITHDGYLILAKIKIECLKNNYGVLPELVDRIQTIPNLSDAIFMKAIALQDVPFDKIINGDQIKVKLQEEIMSQLSSIEVRYESVQRIIHLTDIMFPLSRTKWKEFVINAFNVSGEFEKGSNAYNSQKSIIDAMYRLDPVFARELIKKVDKENRENKIGKLLNDHFDALELSEKIKDNKSLEQIKIENDKILVEGILRSLRLLNSEKLPVKKIKDVYGYLSLGNKLPLYESFPVFAYYLNNCAGQSEDFHNENFKEAVNSTKLIQYLSSRSKLSTNAFRNYFIEEELSSNKTFHPGDRKEALEYIREWIKDEVEEFIVIADPYFTLEDLELLKFIKDFHVNIEIQVLSCKDGWVSDLDEKYASYWNQNYPNELPPFVNFTFCWIKDSINDFPLHDRYLISKNGGLRIGTSFNGIGKKKETEISPMTYHEANKVHEENLKDYVLRKKATRNTQRVAYKSFSM